MLGILSSLRGTWDGLVSLVFPAPCRICGETLASASRIPVCPACLGMLRPLQGVLCDVCGRPLLSTILAQVQHPKCHLCRRGVYHFDLARSYAAYDEAMVRAITLLKYEAVAPLGAWFASRLAEIVQAEPSLFAADVVVPVPLFPTRLRERGYNQAELIGRPFARRLGLPFRAHLLARTKPRPNRLKLSRRERWTSVRGAYNTREPKAVDNARVLLVDDVFTTGATLDACAQALRRAGAAWVGGVTVARVVPNWE